MKARVTTKGLAARSLAYLRANKVAWLRESPDCRGIPSAEAERLYSWMLEALEYLAGKESA
jgi:hypothetical protein